MSCTKCDKNIESGLINCDYCHNLFCEKHITSFLYDTEVSLDMWHVCDRCKNTHSEDMAKRDCIVLILLILFVSIFLLIQYNN